MIGRLRGTVVEAGDEELVLEVGGVGYLLRCGVRTLARLPPLGEEAVIQVESQWSELAGLRLYGFLTAAEKRAFTQLQAIQGVGPKAALAVLDVLSPAELDAAALRQDRAALTRAAGVGPKLAQRIVLELRSKPLTDEPLAAVSRLADGAAPMTPSSEAVSALVGLGWPEAVARRAVDRAADRLGEGVADGALIKAALQDLGR